MCDLMWSDPDGLKYMNKCNIKYFRYWWMEC